MANNIQILIDFGSTFTKVVAIDLDSEEIVAQTRAPSTVSTDITIGLKEALKIISKDAPFDSYTEKKALACSSAAGGLRMVCVGFVPEYTSEAANMAALGAGAKVVGRFSYELNKSEVEEIEGLAPDILLLTGGTNGGNSKVIVHNARLLADSGPAISNIIVAGNKAAYDEIGKIFSGSGKRVTFTRNVMPDIGKLDLAPCNTEIRELFMRNIVEAKGIAKARSIIEDVIMPTPSAVLEAAILLAKGLEDDPGLGELMVVDTGGSTTNVHSIAQGNPQRADIVTVGLPEPYEKRTVEGDLGLKYNLDTLREMLKGKIKSPDFEKILTRFGEGILPQTDAEIGYHKILARLVVETAVNRHSGKIEEAYGPAGRILFQRGKDLTGVNYIIGTGGAIAYSTNPMELLNVALFDEKTPSILKPKKPQLLIDKKYLLYAIGLLSQKQPEKAFRIARKYLTRIPGEVKA